MACLDILQYYDQFQIKINLTAYKNSAEQDQPAYVCLLVRVNIGIKHGFSCINIRQVPWEELKTEAEGCGF